MHEISISAPQAGSAEAGNFRSVEEAGLFLAFVNQRSAALRRDYPDHPLSGDADYEEFRLRRDAIVADAAIILQSPLLLNELRSGDAVRTAKAQISYVAPSLGFDAAIASEVSAILVQAYTDGYGRKLILEGKPSDPAAVPAGEADRAQLNTVASNKIKNSSRRNNANSSPISDATI